MSNGAVLPKSATSQDTVSHLTTVGQLFSVFCQNELHWMDDVVSFMSI